MENEEGVLLSKSELFNLFNASKLWYEYPFGVKMSKKELVSKNFQFMKEIANSDKWGFGKYLNSTPSKSKGVVSAVTESILAISLSAADWDKKLRHEFFDSLASALHNKISASTPELWIFISLLAPQRTHFFSVKEEKFEIVKNIPPITLVALMDNLSNVIKDKNLCGTAEKTEIEARFKEYGKDSLKLLLAAMMEVLISHKTTSLVGLDYKKLWVADALRIGDRDDVFWDSLTRAQSVRLASLFGKQCLLDFIFGSRDKEGSLEGQQVSRVDATQLMKIKPVKEVITYQSEIVIDAKDFSREMNRLIQLELAKLACQKLEKDDLLCENFSNIELEKLTLVVNSGESTPVLTLDESVYRYSLEEWIRAISKEFNCEIKDEHGRNANAGAATRALKYVVSSSQPESINQLGSKINESMENMSLLAKTYISIVQDEGKIKNGIKLRNFQANKENMDAAFSGLAMAITRNEIMTLGKDKSAPIRVSYKL